MQKKLIWICALMALFISGCDLFGTRETENPVIARSSYELATTPQLLLVNLQNSLKERNLPNYIRCFIDTSTSGKRFRFYPSSGASGRYPAFRDLWDLKAEEHFINNLFSQAKQNEVIQLSFTNETFVPSADSCLYTASYQLVFPARETEVSTMYRGEIQLSLFYDSRSWAIGYWQDINNTADKCWSDLKGIYY